MASGKKPTNKTAHVMNLLSKSRPADNIPGAAAPAGNPGDAPDAAAHPPVPPIMASLQPDAEASLQIKEALEAALAGELGDAGPVPQENDPNPGPQPEPEPEPEPLPEPEPAETAAPLSVPVPAGDPSGTPPSAPADPGISCINVMQVLVDEKADKYIKMFGLCGCPRCAADVRALALNNLPPKYVVMPPGQVVPRISVYEGRYSAAVTMQILRACQTVMENPRHDRQL